MSKDPKVFLKHILQSIQLIEQYTNKLSKKEFLESTDKQDMVIRRLAIIGEAVKNLPQSLRNCYNKVAWREIVGMRDILVHEYFDVDLELTWKVIQKDLPLLKKVVKEMIVK